MWSRFKATKNETKSDTLEQHFKINHGMIALMGFIAIDSVFLYNEKS